MRRRARNMRGRARRMRGRAQCSASAYMDVRGVVYGLARTCAVGCKRLYSSGTALKHTLSVLLDEASQCKLRRQSSTYICIVSHPLQLFSCNSVLYSYKYHDIFCRVQCAAQPI